MKQSKEASSGLLCLKDSLQEQLYLRARYWLSSVIRDDVFFAPSFTMYSGAISALAAPCLPPVTPPSDLLVDQEPLFEGIVDLSTEEVSVRRPEKRPGAIMSLKIKKRKHTKPNTKTRFEQLTLKGGVWCRYCGVTEDVNWRPGPWGKKTLCK
ncbi:hypothetical protein BY458DRAFT_503653 [Sporodiniella umbellata]|nr:hypothetical protein BY458DRAFT_503653 [Sporodiniella umbellata]